jgi:hypothetical protein
MYRDATWTFSNGNHSAIQYYKINLLSQRFHSENFLLIGRGKDEQFLFLNCIFFVNYKKNYFYFLFFTGHIYCPLAGLPGFPLQG